MLNLRSAKAEIVRTFWHRTRGDRFVSPYFLVLGSGVSDPAVPTASKLVHCLRNEIAQLGYPQPPETLSPPDIYYECIDRAFPNPELRRDFLSQLIEGKDPSAANFQAARLLGPQGLTSLAVTTNFDGMLPRALSHLGYEFLAFDHPETIVGRFDPKRQKIQILQIHGTCEHYDFCNVRDEILDRAKVLTPLIYALLVHGCPIVVGYSGWEDDAIMSALKLRLNQARGSMKAGLYWMCFTQAEVETLPTWLKDDPSVRVVVASGDSANVTTLPAVEVFGALLKGLEDETLASAQRVPRSGEPILPPSAVALAAAERALVQGEQQLAASELCSLDIVNLTAGERAHCGALLQQVYLGTWQTAPETALMACRLWQSVAEVRGSMETAGQKLMLARAIYGQGLSLLSLGFPKEAIARFTEVQELCRSDEHLLGERLAHAGNAMAVALFREGRTAEAFAQWNDLLRRSIERKDVEGVVINYGLFNLGLASKKIGNTDDARIYWSAIKSGRVSVEGDQNTQELWARRIRAALLRDSLRHLDTDGDGVLDMFRVGSGGQRFALGQQLDLFMEADATLDERHLPNFPTELLAPVGDRNLVLEAGTCLAKSAASPRDLGGLAAGELNAQPHAGSGQQLHALAGSGEQHNIALELQLDLFAADLQMLVAERVVAVAALPVDGHAELADLIYTSGRSEDKSDDMEHKLDISRGISDAPRALIDRLNRWELLRAAFAMSRKRADLDIATSRDGNVIWMGGQFMAAESGLLPCAFSRLNSGDPVSEATLGRHAHRSSHRTRTSALCLPVLGDSGVEQHSRRARSRALSLIALAAAA